jgi:hypothetical protein
VNVASQCLVNVNRKGWFWYDTPKASRRTSLDEKEFDSLMQSRSFEGKDAIQVDVQLRRSITLAIALWGRTLDDLQRRILAPSPEIPSGFDLADFRELQLRVQAISASFSEPQFVSLFSSQTIFVGAQRFTAWEARCEIVRRAIEYLEKH